MFKELKNLEIYFSKPEEFNSNEISKLIKQMAKSQKKYTTDEMLAIFKTIHIYAYFVVNTIIKKDIYRIDLLSEKEYKEIYNEIKHCNEYLFSNQLLQNVHI